MAQNEGRSQYFDHNFFSFYPIELFSVFKRCPVKFFTKSYISFFYFQVQYFFQNMKSKDLQKVVLSDGYAE
jgi:hypothetical protein